MRWLSRCAKKLRVGGVLAAVVLVSCTNEGSAAPDYDQIGRQFSEVLQYTHFSRQRFSPQLYARFLDCYVQSIDPQHLYFTQKDVDGLHRKYDNNFGVYLVRNSATKLAQDLYLAYRQRVLKHLDQVESILKEYETDPPKFDSDRGLPRSRRKLPRAEDDAALNQVWRDQVEDMLLAEVCRREDLARIAAEKGKPDPTAKDPKPIDKIRARMKRVRMEVQEADMEDMITLLLNAVAHVYDPHSDYMGAREEKQFKDAIKASLVGIGAQLREDDDGSIRIEGIVKGSPADKSGQLKLGDHIVAVDTDADGRWTDILYMSIDKVVNLIRGKKGRTVNLRVLSTESGVERVVSIVRDEVPMSESMASARIIDLRENGPQGEVRNYRLGVLILPSFYVDLDDVGNGSAKCSADVRKLLNRMVHERVQGLVVDLRSNGGGSLEEVRRMVGYFTGTGPVVQVKDARGRLEGLSVDGINGRPLFNGELVVLTSKGSASASEIFAGAMKDYGRALIVGDKTTFGKGTVQVPRNLGEYMPLSAAWEDCGLIKVTVQKFYRINGESTQMRGVPSDIELPTPTTGLSIAESEFDYAMPYDRIAPARGYVRSARLDEMLPRLRERSAARVAADKDLQNNVWFADFRSNLVKQNRISLNKQMRQAQNNRLRDFRKKAMSEKKDRYEAMRREDKKHLTIYRLNCSDVLSPQLPLASEKDDESFMREAKDPEEELEEDISFPSGLDPVLRETVYIVRDMVDLH